MKTLIFVLLSPVGFASTQNGNSELNSGDYASYDNFDTSGGEAGRLI